MTADSEFNTPEQKGNNAMTDSCYQDVELSPSTFILVLEKHIELNEANKNSASAQSAAMAYSHALQMFKKVRWKNGDKGTLL